jgi:hypothetical protein
MERSGTRNAFVENMLKKVAKYKETSQFTRKDNSTSKDEMLEKILSVFLCIR